MTICKEGDWEGLEETRRMLRIWAVKGFMGALGGLAGEPGQEAGVPEDVRPPPSSLCLPSHLPFLPCPELPDPFPEGGQKPLHPIRVRLWALGRRQYG